MRCLILALAWIFLPLTCGTGISTHMDAGERMARYYDLVSDDVDYSVLLRRHQDALQAGLPYPDAYWSSRFCFDGNYRQVSEDTHWTPFLNASVNYIRRVYPKPWDWFTEKLVVFLLGIAGHQAQDVNWHGHDLDQGFLDAMGAHNYHGSFSGAHHDADLGADVLTVFETDTSFLGVVAKWYVPIDDLVKIYEELYGQPDRITGEVIENCTRILFLERFGESLGLIEALYPKLARNSPFILDWFGDYFLGGVDDMAVWSGYLWNRVILMLDNGTSACDLAHNPVYMRCNGSESVIDQTKSASTRAENAHGSESVIDQTKSASTRAENAHEIYDFWDFDVDDDVLVQRTSRGTYLTAGQLTQELTLQELPTSELLFCNETCETPTAYYVTEHSYSRLGRQVVSGDVNGDGSVDVVISAPSFSTPGNYQGGRVYVIYGMENGIPNTDSVIETMADLILTGEKLNGRFGISVAIVDFNADGLNDLAISAPSIGSENLDYRGQVYIYLNDEVTGIQDIPSITIDCTERNCNFGWTLEIGDLNGDGYEDLMIGSPFAPSGGTQRGFVSVFYASPVYTEGLSLTELDASWKFSGQQNYEWFGYSVSSGQVSSDTWLLIGAPTYRICTQPSCEYLSSDVQSVGRVYVFRSLLFLQLLEGEKEFEQFGFSVKVASWNGQDVAIVSSPSGDLVNISTNSTENLEQSGIVSVFTINTSGVQQQEPLFVLEGEREFSRFGSTLLVYRSLFDGKTNILVTAPYRSEDIRTHRESGRIFLYQNVTQDVTKLQPDRIFGIAEDKARFGSSLAVVTSQNKVQLVVGAEHFTNVTRLGGAVGIIDL